MKKAHIVVLCEREVELDPLHFDGEENVSEMVSILVNQIQDDPFSFIEEANIKVSCGKLSEVEES